MRPPIVLYEAPRRLHTDYRIGFSAWKRMLLEDWQPPNRARLIEELADRRAAASPRPRPRRAA